MLTLIKTHNSNVDMYDFENELYIFNIDFKEADTGLYVNIEDYESAISILENMERELAK